jgi:hypothetical protein
MSDKSVWATLSAIDCTEHVEDKGGFSYLSWTWAWAMVCEKYPDALYQFQESEVFPDGSMEVRCEVTIEGLTRQMWLPVLDFRNKAIKNPDAMAVNTAKMRCLVKNLCMHGLGHYIYAGESVPQEPVVVETKPMILAGAEMNRYLEEDDYHGAAQIFEEWEHAEHQIICRAPSNGGQLTTANRVKLKSTEFRLALNEARGIVMEEAS